VLISATRPYKKTRKNILPTLLFVAGSVTLKETMYMRFIHLFSILVVISHNCFCQDNNKYSSKDLASLNSLPVKFEHYWNIHNMDSMGTMLTGDVDFVNVAGMWLKGKSATVARHKEVHLTQFKSSMWTTDSVEIKYIKPDLAIMHIGWGISGDFDPDGTPRTPRHGIFTWVVNKEKGQWLLLAVHNVNIRDPVSASK
jgi:uncharacterized protein (TIGR02246 family)